MVLQSCAKISGALLETASHCGAVKNLRWVKQSVSVSGHVQLVLRKQGSTFLLYSKRGSK